ALSEVCPAIERAVRAGSAALPVAVAGAVSCVPQLPLDLGSGGELRAPPPLLVKGEPPAAAPGRGRAPPPWGGPPPPHGVPPSARRATSSSTSSRSTYAPAARPRSSSRP